jgi:hypothetical protein
MNIEKKGLSMEPVLRNAGRKEAEGKKKKAL